LGVSERVGWSRGVYRERPAGCVSALDAEQSRRMSWLGERYDVRFEVVLGPATSVKNYEYLDILDRAFTASGLARPMGGVLCDVGCASFWYAATLQAFFRPRELVGVEVEGHRLFRDGHSRIDYAYGYVGALPNARFMVADYATLELPADVITAWFPFVTPGAILAWRLPLSLLKPERLFARIHGNLRPAGRFIMVNHGEAEASRAADLCSAAGLRLLARSGGAGILSTHRLNTPIVSCWTRQGSQA
jgi:SAM-dependent methyltransferase